MTESPLEPASRKTKNPYVGPKAFSRLDPLYGRDRETAELTDLVIAQRIVLLHAPSGAGKTSLIESAVAPRLEEEGFVVTPLLRVNAVAPCTVSSRYVWSVAIGLLGDGKSDGVELAGITLAEAVDRYAADADSDYVLVFDQFEELVSLDPADWRGQEDFFRQLGDVLDGDRRWCLISMREDYIGGLARFAPLVPTHLRTTYRLDFLVETAATQAIRKPAETRGVDFTATAAERLFAELAKQKVESPGGAVMEARGPYVEPVQLQVVCHQLWRAKRHNGDGSPFKAITDQDVKRLTNVDGALADFYGAMVHAVATDNEADERAIRDWCEHALITKEGYRSQTKTGPVGVADPTKVLRDLESHYVIRGDDRGTGLWYELTHDRLIKPVRANNADWRRSHLDELEIWALEWDESGRREAWLLPAELVRGGQRFFERKGDRTTEIERAFIRSCVEARKQARLLDRFSKAVAILAAIAALELAVILGLLAWP